MKRPLALLSVALMLLSGQVVYKEFQPKEEKFVDVVDRVMPACVTIYVADTIGGVPVAQWLGSGVYVSKNGYILTCAHLFNDHLGKLSVTVELENGDLVAADIINVSDRFDLALIRTTYFEEAPYCKVADPRKLRVGQEVFAVGAPHGLAFTVTTGIISALYRDFTEHYNVTQSDTAINPGNSGGPLFNLKGEIVGINSFMILGVKDVPLFTGLGFSVQSGECIVFLTQCKRLVKDLVL